MDAPLRCQFCDTHPGHLVAFAKSWACMMCIYKYGLEDHPMFGGYAGEWWDDEYYYYSGRTHHYRPTLSGVTIEELPCNGENLVAVDTKIYVYNPPAEAKEGTKKWQIDIWY